MVSRGTIGTLGFFARDTTPTISGDRTAFVANRIAGWTIALLSAVGESGLHTVEVYHRRPQERVGVALYREFNEGSVGMIERRSKSEEDV